MKNTKFLTVKELPLSERPYEKCEESGASSLTDAELLAVIIKSGAKNQKSIDVAHHILKASEQNPGLISLNYFTQKELMEIKGIGRVKAIQLLCVAELAKRITRASRLDGIRITSPESVANFYMPQMRCLTIEKIIAVFIDSKSKILKDMVVSIGTVNASLAVPRELFLNALKQDAAGLIVLHNHPSGDPAPSKEDLAATKRIKEAGEIIGIPLIDHLIIGDNRYISLKEIGIL